MLNSSSHGNNELTKQLKEAMSKLVADHVMLKEKLKKVSEENGELENTFVVKENDDMETLERKRENCKKESRKAKVMLAKTLGARTTAENMKAYTDKQNVVARDGAKKAAAQKVRGFEVGKEY